MFSRDLVEIPKLEFRQIQRPRIGNFRLASFAEVLEMHLEEALVCGAFDCSIESVSCFCLSASSSVVKQHSTGLDSLSVRMEARWR